MADLILMENVRKELESYLSCLQDSSLKKLYFNVIKGFQDYVATSPHSLQEALFEFYAKLTLAIPFNKPPTIQLRKKARVLRMLNDIIQRRPPQRKYCYDTVIIPNEFSHEITVYTSWMESQNNSIGTIYTRCGRIKVFLIFLSVNKCHAVESISLDIVLSFIAFLSEKKYTSQGKANILYTLRSFFACPDISSRLTCDPMPLISNIHSRKHERLASCYTTTEIQQVMSIVDRTTKAGKTDYLMMILACVYGLRVSDIRELKLTSIQWKNKFIALCQHKTRKYIELPLTKPVTFALLDYIKNVRPSSEDPHVFIKQRSPHEPYSSHDHFSYRIAHYFAMAGINTDNKHHGLHSMRHSLATELVTENFPVNEVATIMGHSTVASTCTYIWSDIKHLKLAALEVNLYD